LKSRRHERTAGVEDSKNRHGHQRPRFRLLESIRHSRPHFRFDPGFVDETIALLDRFAEFVTAEPLKISLADPDDLPFLEVALTGQADALITGNRKDFGRAPKGLKILSPREFLTEIGL